MAHKNLASANIPATGNTYFVAPPIMESVTSTALASFSDGAENCPVEDLTVEINPVQSGSGDPSPSNVRPITGWTAMNVYRTGKNLINFPDCASTSVTNINTAYNLPYWGKLNDYYPFKANTRYTFSCQYSTAGYWGLRVVYTDGTNAYLWLHNKTTDSASATTASGKTVETISFSHSGMTANLAFSNAQLEEGTTATEFERSGTTYPISWEDEAGTVYGGTLDVTTGLLTVDRAYVDFTNISWNLRTTGSVNRVWSGALPSNYVGTGSGAKAPFTASAYSIGFNTSASGLINSVDSLSPSIRGANTTSETDSILCVDSKERDNPVGACVYELATPQTYQLDPTEVKTLLGENHLWADTGDVAVDYFADTKKYIDKVLNA